jgi:hypothetical protein
MSTALEIPRGLPSVAAAKLPAAYESAKTALATCARLDECRDWANRMEAIASYAKQSEDESLQRMAEAIRARAIRRCGELLSEIRAAQGGGQPGTRGGAPPCAPTRKSIARDAGMSDDQRKQALRIARIPAAEFEALVESKHPPTVGELAERGTKKLPKPLIDLEGRDPTEFAISTQGQGRIRELAEYGNRTDPEVIVRGAFEAERRRMRNHAKECIAWLERVIRCCERRTNDAK